MMSEASNRAPPPRRRTNLSLDPRLVDEAKELGINLSRTVEHALSTAIAAARAKQWREENKAAIDGTKSWVTKNEAPLRRHRKF
ncbi:type II toxin-antitoxin system CcdA family antitoxin [Sphingosinicella sp. BN140058]|uniref:type II toxin-antitoxin system CcdA family antitoxin n=1 Tax=Sphingosinicella sp. BN140058 TaxID=1892855 RepID=UPI001FB17CA1|nr:type II toxin-antitoxin system CcdA family antitoxin [Sphingosinicella sp. BN140058]